MGAEEERPRGVKVFGLGEKEGTTVFLRMRGPQLASPWAARVEARILSRVHHEAGRRQGQLG